jgi:hypothetical protein
LATSKRRALRSDSRRRANQASNWASLSGSPAKLASNRSTRKYGKPSMRAAPPSRTPARCTTWSTSA